ncbi:MAG: hypothetical protein NVSMB38_20990 [Ktedonobacteraceae bacterium]
MSLTPIEHRPPSSTDEKGKSSNRSVLLRSWLFSWEIYLIVIVAGFLRLYRIDRTEFDDDQAAVFRMAHDAVTHGLLVATSNIASIHIYNPPAIIYFFMLPAAFSADPLWGAVMVGVLMTLSVLLTYIFVRRYYGRVAATIVALLYATAARPIFYARFIWNQNLLPILTILLLFALFWGVVERKKGWLAPAIFLLGVLVQLHATGIMMVFPLGVALLLAPKTLRWRDLALGCVALLVSYFPYLLWEVSTNFIDVHTLLTVTKQPVFIDDKAWGFYQLFLSPYDYANPPDKHTLLGSLVPALAWMREVMTALVIGGAITALVSVLWSRVTSMSSTAQHGTKKTVWTRIRGYLIQFRASPYRCGLTILLIWQIVPILILTRHSIGLYAHYMIILMPGPFILIGLLLAKISAWTQRRLSWTAIIRYGMYVLACILIIAQFMGSTAGMLDMVRGNFNDRVLLQPYYSDLHSLQAALHEADQVAQQHHFNRVYVSSDSATQAALRYLSEQMQTPTTVFDAYRCAVLPSIANGPALMLIGPYNTFTDALIRHFAQITLVATPKRLSGAPFKLYIVQATETQLVGGGSFGSDLQLLDPNAHPFSANGDSWLVTRWRMLRSAQPSYQKVYMYNVLQLSRGSEKPNANSLCTFTSMRAGDQLLVVFKQLGASKNSQNTPPLMMKVQTFEASSYNLTYGPISFETYRDSVTPKKTLYTSAGKDSLTVSIAQP